MSADEQVPRPTAGDVLYVNPNPDRTRKMCANCFLWSPDDQTCLIHDPGVVVVTDMVCGYHVFGTPQPKDLVLEGLDVVQPENSGLEQVAGGTSCDNCKYYRHLSESGGYCLAVCDSESSEDDLLVDALGCCARWRQAI